MLFRLITVLVPLFSAAVVFAQTWEEKVIASVLMAEAASEGETGMVAVAEVIRQRCVEKGQTPLSVVSKRRAFSSLNGIGKAALVAKQASKPLFAKAVQIAITLCREPQRLPGITRQANHFTLKTERPAWARGTQPVTVIGNHAFYRMARW